MNHMDKSTGLQQELLGQRNPCHEAPGVQFCADVNDRGGSKLPSSSQQNIGNFYAAVCYFVVKLLVIG